MTSTEILELFGLEVIVRGPIKGGFRLKVSYTKIGMYIDGFTARPNVRMKSGWWIQSPAFKIGLKFVNVPEYDKHTQLWLLIEELCIRAVLDYQINASDSVRDVDLSPESIAANMDSNIGSFGIGKEDSNDHR